MTFNGIYLDYLVTKYIRTLRPFEEPIFQVSYYIDQVTPLFLLEDT